MRRSSTNARCIRLSHQKSHAGPRSYQSVRNNPRSIQFLRAREELPSALHHDHSVLLDGLVMSHSCRSLPHQRLHTLIELCTSFHSNVPRNVLPADSLLFHPIIAASAHRQTETSHRLHRVLEGREEEEEVDFNPYSYYNNSACSLLPWHGIPVRSHQWRTQWRLESCQTVSI